MHCELCCSLSRYCRRICEDSDNICSGMIGARNKPCISFCKSARDRRRILSVGSGKSRCSDGLGQMRLRSSDASILRLSAKRRMCCQISSGMVTEVTRLQYQISVAAQASRLAKWT